MKIIQEFKEFAIKGNVVDMAVGIIIGGAFGKIITSMVSNVVMPPIGLLIGGVNFSDLKVTLKDAAIDASGKTIPAVAINYGQFLQTIFDFLIIAFIIFIAIKAINIVRRKKDEEPAPAPSQEEILLTEIRDILKSSQKD